MPAPKRPWTTHILELIDAGVLDRDEIIRFSGCAPDKVVVIPVPISERFVATPRPFNAARPVLLQVGQATNKNLSRIIPAVSGLAVRRPI